MNGLFNSDRFENMRNRKRHFTGREETADTRGAAPEIEPETETSRSSLSLPTPEEWANRSEVHETRRNAFAKWAERRNSVTPEREPAVENITLPTPGEDDAAAPVPQVRNIVNYDNAGLTLDQVKAAQRAAGLTGIDVDGLWGPKTTAAVGMTAAQYTGRAGGKISGDDLAKGVQSIINNGGGANSPYEDALDYANAKAASGVISRSEAAAAASAAIQSDLAAKVRRGAMSLDQAVAIMDRLGIE